MTAQTNGYFRRGKSTLWSLGRILLSSYVIHICVRVVILVLMIRTCPFVAAQVKSCPSMHSGCMIASLWLCSHSWPPSEIRGMTKELIKGNYWPLTQERMSR